MVTGMMYNSDDLTAIVTIMEEPCNFRETGLRIGSLNFTVYHYYVFLTIGHSEEKKIINALRGIIFPVRV